MSMQKFMVLCLCILCVNSVKISIRDIPKDLFTASPENLARHILHQVNTYELKSSSSKCSKQLRQYASGLSHLEGWAINMFDANAKFPSGLLRGYGSALGSFDQCINIQDERNNETIRGKYCIGALQLIDLEMEARNVRNAPWGIQPKYINLNDENLNLPWGTCLPDGCSAEDAELFALPGFKYMEATCQTAITQTTKYDASDYSAIAFLGMVSLLMILSTAYETTAIIKKKESCSEILRSFSVISNTRKIIKVDKRKELSYIHGMRVISMLFLMYGFRYALYILSPLDNWLDMINWITNQKITVYFEGIIVADTFFVITGMFITYNYLKAEESGVKFNLIFYYLNRIIRLTPPLMVVVFFHATLMRHIGFGPIWPMMRSHLLVDNCREYWWSTILYAQNYVNPNSTCLMQTWYTTVDMQLFIVSPILLLAYSIASKLFLVIFGLTLVGAIIASFTVAWNLELHALMLVNLLPENYSIYMNNVFFAIHTRIPPWAIGLILGVILYKSQLKSSEKTMRKIFSPVVVLFCWITATGLVLLCFVSPAIVGEEYVRIKNALHIALIRPVWSLGISWVIFACAHGFSGPVKYILSAPIFQMISRISYCTFLTNFSVMAITTLQTRKGLEFSNYDVFYRFWPDLAFTLTTGFICTLAFESPIIALLKVVSPAISKLPLPLTKLKRTAAFRIKCGSTKLKINSQEPSFFLETI